MARGEEGAGGEPRFSEAGGDRSPSSGSPGGMRKTPSRPRGLPPTARRRRSGCLRRSSSFATSRGGSSVSTSPISAGKHAVGSLVAFAAGIPAKEGYRRFRIRTVPGADDYAMMYEVLKRRYEKRENLPDLIMVDGGKGQLGVALAVLKDLGIEGVDVIGLAKERDEAGVGPDRMGRARQRRRGRKDAGNARKRGGPRLSSRAEGSRLPLPLAGGPLSPPADPRRGAPLRRHLPPEGQGKRRICNRSWTGSRASARRAARRC